MIGSFVILGKENYLQININGTLQKLPKLRWYYQVYFAFKNAFKGYVDESEVIYYARKGEREEAWL